MQVTAQAADVRTVQRFVAYTHTHTLNACEWRKTVALIESQTRRSIYTL